MCFKINCARRFGILLLFAACFFNFTKQTPQPEVIIWNKNRPLTWEDFKAQFSTETENAATTSSGIKWRTKTKKDSLTVTVEALMYPLRSRVKLELCTYSILKHEQLHFDITELYARKLRQTILAQKIYKKGMGVQLNTIVSSNDKQLDQYQDFYDLETNHSKVKSKQTEWEQKVAKELKALEAYSNTEVKLLLK